MGEREKDLLATELGKVAQIGGRISGENGAELGASMGARFAARFLPTEQHTEAVTVARDAATVLTRLRSYFAACGRVADDREADSSAFPKISGVIGSGFLRMNPAIVHVEVIVAQGDMCRLQVSGAAKEGLIKQRSAEKAVIRISEFLRTIGEPGPPAASGDATSGGGA